MENRDVKPFVDVKTKDFIYKLSFITGMSVKQICRDLYYRGIEDGLGMELSPCFKRDLHIDGYSFKGDRYAKKFEPYSSNIERIAMKINDKSYEYAYNLAFATGSSISKVVSYAIEKSMKDFEFLDQYIKQFLIENVDTDKRNILLEIVNVINKDYVEEDLTIASLLMHLTDEHRRLEDGITSVLNEVVISDTVN